MALYNPGMPLPITVVTNAEPGDVVPVTAAVDDVTLNLGYYKIAAMGTSLLWKLESDDVTVLTGSYLAAGDQEIIEVPADGTKLSFIRSTDATVDGEINIVRIVFANPSIGAPQNNGAPI